MRDEQKVNIREAMQVLLKALELCNESRNRLTSFQSTPDTWIKEAYAAQRKGER